MIKINKVTIANFRSYKATGNKINDVKRINLFTGKNNSGKTNILRAIDLFFNPEQYNPKIDMNMVKQITGGATKHPKIKIEFIDNELRRGQPLKYTIELDLNVDNENEEQYKLIGSKTIEELSTKGRIKKHLESKFKCIYLSTTDENLSDQAFALVNDMILKYYKQKNKKIKDSIEEFESNYKNLLSTFEQNIEGLEKDLSKEFELFQKNNIDIEPKLKIENNIDISEFLTNNIKLELDDSYSQVIKSKGAGIQRTSLILLSFFLLNEIYKTTNKIILIDEPEAFLYPLLISGLKNSIEESSSRTENSQIFLTSHSREFLTEINNSSYSFYNVEQKSEKKEYKRSSNNVDINKYSIINQFDAKTKFEVLKNYGLLDNINDHESVIICEGKTDRNYLIKILEGKEYRPQIRYERYSDFIDNNTESLKKDLEHNFVPSGARAIIPILMYLDRVSEVQRRVFVLLDGDEEGKKVSRTINQNEFKHLNIKKFVIADNKEIEDMVFSKNDFYEKMITISEEFYNRKTEFKDALTSVKPADSFIVCVENFIKTFSLNIKINEIKHLLSIDLEKHSIQKDWILDDLERFYY